MSYDFLNEIKKRKTMAIISHPDAGKTTLTEKFLLYGGAIQAAGAVKSNKIKKTAASDFMEIEKQRGISVSTAVMSFYYKGYKINLLDTPGHKDFAEDTYRTLTAVDSVILVVDSVKGVEEQTEKLANVCRMRSTPISIFINKLDREGKDPFDLLDELENKLNIKVLPLTFPVGKGQSFKGVYNLYEKKFNLFKSEKTKVEEEIITITDLDDPVLIKWIGNEEAKKLKESSELIDGFYGTFNLVDYLNGKVAPVFFGSALKNFGVREILNCVVEISPSPLPRESDKGPIFPESERFTGFVFKIHANIDPRHRDRIAFLRICSGKFERNKFFTHARLNKEVRFTNPYTFLAQEKSVIDEAYPGDVIGLYDSGIFKIGDALTDGESLNFVGIPSFSPEIFKELINEDPMKSKQLEKGIRQLTDEGVAQLFYQSYGNRKIIGSVGELQFEVIQYRLLNEYGAACRFSTLSFSKARWITAEKESDLIEFIKYKPENIAIDKDGNYVYLAESDWMLERTMEKNPKINFHSMSDFKIALKKIA